MADKALAALKSLWSKLPIKAPWKVCRVVLTHTVEPYLFCACRHASKYTGPASSVEFQSHLPVATEYRKNAPGSQTVQAMVPSAEPNLVYNIKYYDRDTRRSGQNINGSGAVVYNTYQVKLSEPDPELEARAPPQALRAAGTPPTPGKPYRWGKPTKLTDVENNGYTFTPPEPPAPVEGARPQNYQPQT